MPTVFDFNEGAFVNLNGATATGTLATFSDGGISFTLSLTNVTGSADASLGGSSFPSFPIFLSRGNATGVTGDVYELAVAGGAGTFSGTGGDQVVLNYKSLTGSVQVRFTHNTAGGTVTHTINRPDDGIAGNVAATGTFTGVTFTMNLRPGSMNTFSSIIVESLSVKSITCFCAGTKIATPDGDVSVEDLQPGDKITTADGGTTTVKWLGIQSVHTQLTDPTVVNPICIRAGALADSVPERDLFVSGDHGIEIDGILYNAGALVNGSSIYRVAQMPSEGFTYYHVETDEHDLILAEGCSAESYLDVIDRTHFDNGAEREGAQAIREMALPRISASRMVPQDVREQLVSRASLIAGTRKAA
jgi:hypothetical protein